MLNEPHTSPYQKKKALLDDLNHFPTRLNDVQIPNSNTIQPEMLREQSGNKNVHSKRKRDDSSVDITHSSQQLHQVANQSNPQPFMDFLSQHGGLDSLKLLESNQMISNTDHPSSEMNSNVLSSSIETLFKLYIKQNMNSFAEIDKSHTEGHSCSSQSVQDFPFQYVLDTERSSKKQRGNYRCRVCGKPKKGHKCTVQSSAISENVTSQPHDLTHNPFNSPSYKKRTLPPTSPPIPEPSCLPEPPFLSNQSVHENEILENDALQSNAYIFQCLSNFSPEQKKLIKTEAGISKTPENRSGPSLGAGTDINIASESNNKPTHSSLGKNSVSSSKLVCVKETRLGSGIGSGIGSEFCSVRNVDIKNGGRRVFTLDSATSWLKEVNEEINDEYYVRKSMKQKEKGSGENSSMRGDRVRKELTFSPIDYLPTFSRDEKIHMKGKKLNFDDNDNDDNDHNYDNVNDDDYGGEEEDSIAESLYCDSYMKKKSIKLEPSKVVRKRSNYLPQDKCLMIILSKLTPIDLISASFCCKRWKRLADEVWNKSEEVSLILNKNRNFSYFSFILHKSPNLHSIRFKSYIPIDDTFLQTMSSMCIILKFLNIQIPTGVNSTITGDGISYLLQSCPFLESIQIDGCENVTNLKFDNFNLRKLSLYSCPNLTRAEFHCPNLQEIGFDFMDKNLPRVTNLSTKPKPSNPLPLKINAKENQTKMISLFRQIVKFCPSLKTIYVASSYTTDEVVKTILSEKQSFLTTFSFTFSPSISDDSSVEIARQCRNLQIIDLSGCTGISNMSVNILCCAFRKTLSKLLLSACPHLTASGIQSSVQSLPNLTLLDLGHTFVREPRADVATPTWNPLNPFHDIENPTVLPNSDASHRSQIGKMTKLRFLSDTWSGNSRVDLNHSLVNNCEGIDPVDDDDDVNDDTYKHTANASFINDEKNIKIKSKREEVDHTEEAVSMGSGNGDGEGVMVKHLPLSNGRSIHSYNAVKGMNGKSIVVNEGRIESLLTKSCSWKENIVEEDAIFKFSNSMVEKMSLWGCSNLEGLILDCPSLVELNLNNCINLKAQSSFLSLNCPSLKRLEVHGCSSSLISLLNENGFSAAMTR